MRRILIVALALALLIVGTFLVSFTFSDHRVSGQGYFTSLGDFVFMIDTYRRQSFGLPPPALDDRRFAAAMERFRPTTHNEVERRLVWQFARWGEAAVPRLSSELRPGEPRHRTEGAVRALGEIGGESAVSALGDWLCSLPRQPGPPVRRQVNVAVKALGRTREPGAVRVLERCAGARLRADELDAGTYREALALSRGGAEELLAKFEASRDAEEVYQMLWDLAATRDPRVARAMAPLLRHPLGHIRQRTRDSMDQSMGSVAIDPVLDVLEGERDGYVVSAIIRHILDDSDARGSFRVVPVLEGFVGHPALSRDAVYALSKLGTPEAIEVLRALARVDPDAVFQDMDLIGEGGLPIVADLLASPDPGLRRRAIHAAVQIYAPGARPLVVPLRDDPDPWVAREAARALPRLDKVELHASWAASLPGDLARQAWYAFRPGFFGQDRGIERMWPVLTGVHWAGVLLSALLGLLLIFKVVSVFEPYRFQLFVTFLLVEGFVGDFFFMDQGPDPWLRYQLATGVHLFLLIGFLCLPRDVAPGELRGRLEVLGGASVWVLVPLLLLVGSPVLGQALRRSMADFGNVTAWLTLLVVLCILVFEQWLVPWHLFPRRARLERVVRGTLSAIVLALLAFALVAHARSLSRAGDGDGTVMALLLVLPLVFMLLVHLHALGFLRGQGRPPELAPAPGRLRVLLDGESVRIRRARGRTWGGRLFRLALVLTPAVVAGAVSGASGKASGMVLAFAAAPLGAALGALAVLLLEYPLVIQVRRGWVRSATTLLGASFGRAGWRRRLPRPGMEKRAAAEWSDLSAKERDWLLDVVAGGSGAAPAGSARGAQLSLELRPGPRGDPEAGLLTTRLRVTNEGAAPVSPADLDDHAGTVSWTARTSGDTLPLYLSREEREGQIPPGERVVLRPRIDVGRERTGAVTVKVTCPAGTSNEVTLEPRGGRS